MKIKRFFVAAALMIVSSVAVMAQEMPPIPIDPQVRIGKLDNGLTYYIRHNEYPEHVANFYIAQRVGSIQEDDSQRGLAHFLEHMAFNGSENFKGNGIIDFTRGLGVEFGSDLNAYTSIDQTVYRVCNVPTKRTTAIDSCLLILKDWSNGLLLEEEEIIKERDVVHNEWRMGESASQRIITRALPKIYPGSKYGERMPIGLMSVIDSFKPKTLMDYYHKWYRPDNQAVIIVGDVDVDHIEAEVKRLFSGIKVDPNAPKVVAEEVPDNNEAIYVFEKDKEMTMNQLFVMMKTDATPDEDKASMAYLIQDYIINVIGNMFNSRLTEMTEDPDCPFVQAFADYGQYMLSKTKDNFEFVAVPKEGKDMEALKSIIRESRRVRQFGFTATEYERAKADYLASLEKQYTNRDKRENYEFGNAYRDHFLSNEPIPSLEYLNQTMSQIVPMLPVDIVNQVLPELIAESDTNLVVMEWAREAEGLVYPTEDDMRKAVAEARAEQLQAYVDNVKDEPLILPENMPKKGKIKKETVNNQFGYKELTLSNGATVLLKKTDFKDDEVQLQAFAKGGKSLYGESDYTNLKLFDQIIGYSGLGNFSSTELQKALAGKNCNADLSMGLTRQYATAHSTPKDLETMFQMLYLYFTKVGKDEKMVSNLMTQLDMALKNKHLQPQAVFSDSLSNTMYNHNPRFASLQAEDLKDVNYDRILEIAKDRYKNAGQFTFIICGNFDEATIRPLIEQYVASLPGKKGKADNFKDVRTLATGKVVNDFTVKTDSPNAMSYLIWTAPMEYTLENEVKLDAVGQILSQIYLATIREEESAAYTCGSYGSFDLSASQPIARLIAVSQGNPEKNARAVELLYKGFNDNMNSIDTDALNKVKEYMLKQADVDAKTNNYWINKLTTWKDYGLDFHTQYKKVVESLNAQSLQQFMKHKRDSNGNYIIEFVKIEKPEDANVHYSNELLNIINLMLEEDKNKRKSSKYFLDMIKNEFSKKYRSNSSIDAIMRCLYSFKDLTAYYQNLKANLEKMPITKAYINCLNSFTKQILQCWFDSIKYFREILCTENTKFDKSKEIDPKLVLAFLIHQMHSEINDKISQNSIMNQHYINSGEEKAKVSQEEMLYIFGNKLLPKFNSYISRKLLGLTKTTNICRICNIRTFSFIGSFFITFDLEKIQKMFNGPLDIEKCFYIQNNYNNLIQKFCIKCLTQTNHSQYKTFYSAPDLLIISFQRGIDYSQKIPVSIKDIIDLSNLIESGGKKYKLVGFINKNSDNGKYYSIISFNNSYFKCEDNRVNGINQPNIFNDQKGELIMAFYEVLNFKNY